MKNVHLTISDMWWLKTKNMFQYVDENYITFGSLEVTIRVNIQDHMASSFKMI